MKSSIAFENPGLHDVRVVCRPGSGLSGYGGPTPGEHPSEEEDSNENRCPYCYVSNYFVKKTLDKMVEV